MCYLGVREEPVHECVQVCVSEGSVCVCVSVRGAGVCVSVSVRVCVWSRVVSVRGAGVRVCV